MSNQSDPRIIELLESIASNTREVLTWLQLAYGGELRQRLEGLLDDPRKVLAYEYSTGENSSRAVAGLAGVSEKTIRVWWRDWMEQEIVEPSSVEGRFRRRFSLRRLGIEISAEPSTRKASAEAE